MAEKIERNREATNASQQKTAQAVKKAEPAAKKAAETAKKPASAAKKAAETVQQAEASNKNNRKVMTPKKSGSSIGYRIGAIILWILALGFEVLAIMALLGNFTIRFTHNGNTNMWILLIGCIVLDMACAIFAAQLWKKANYISPMSEKRGKFLFYLWNELGVIMACICFIPLIILLLKNDKLDKKMKTIVAIVAIAALLITGATSAEYHPLSQEQQLSAENAFENVDVYWTQFGHVFHLNPDECSYIKDRDYYVGAVDEAMSSGKTRICTYCENHASDESWNTPESVLTWIANQKALAEEDTDLKEAVTPSLNINTGSEAPTATGGN